MRAPRAHLPAVRLPLSSEDRFPEDAPYDVFMAEGAGGQVGMVVPRQKLVLISMGNASDPSRVAPVMYEAMSKVL